MVVVLHGVERSAQHGVLEVGGWIEGGDGAGEVLANAEMTGSPCHLLAGADDRFFPVALQRRVARERLGIEPDVRPGGHLIALAHPRDVAGYLVAAAP